MSVSIKTNEARVMLDGVNEVSRVTVSDLSAWKDDETFLKLSPTAQMAFIQAGTVKVDNTSPVAAPKTASNRPAHTEAIANGIKLLESETQSGTFVAGEGWQAGFLQGKCSDKISHV